MAAAVQVTPYIITDFPETLVTPSAHVKIAWQKTSDVIPTDSGTIYFSRSPGGGDIANYEFTVDNADIANDKVGERRQTWFYPEQQQDMGIGRYYGIVAWVQTTPMGSDTFYSNELPLIIEKTQPVEITAPSQDTIEALTPTFEWNANQGVPYYHVILSDEKISIDSSEGGELDVEGISIIWQAITPNTQITYGAPDPSGTITASPPPLSPGKTYSLVVLNNYGNNMMYTSKKFGLPKTFDIRGDTLKAPRNVYPDGQEITDSTFTFTWTNLDTGANTYKIYIYKSSGDDIIEGINAQLAVWDDEVGAGQFTDTGRVTIDAKSVLTENHYTWKVMAVDDKGAGTSGDTTGFDFTSPTGEMTLHTIERITAGGEVLSERAVGLVEIQVEVLGGSMEQPLAYYTNSSGRLSRDRPVGTYRVTAVKSGYNNVTRTITITEGETTRDTLFMSRPEATMYGDVVTAGGSGIDAATVTAVSERGDTVSTETDNSGNFVISCYESDWTVTASKQGYIPSDPLDATTAYGENENIGGITLQHVPYTLSGIVTNDRDEPILGVNVSLYQSSNKIGEVPSTPQSGAYSFSVQPGTYTLSATKVGFASASRTIEVTGSQQQNITLYPGAAEIRGKAVGKAFTEGAWSHAPITTARIHFAAAQGDTFTTTANATYGTYRMSLRARTAYTYWVSARGYDTMAPESLGTLAGDSTYELQDTLVRYAIIGGSVNTRDSTDGTTRPQENATVSLIDAARGDVVAETRSQADGSFEISGVEDGAYTVTAGAGGMILDSIFPAESLDVSQGRPVFTGSDSTALRLFLVPGAKTLSVTAMHNGGALDDARLKIQSPLQYTEALPAQIDSVGAGRYVVKVDAAQDSLLDLSFHAFTIPDSVDTFHAVVALNTVHMAADTLPVDDSGYVHLSLYASGGLDSAYCYYRDQTQRTFKAVRCSAATGDSLYAHVIPPRDGSYLEYYFLGYTGEDVYGDNSEVFRSYVKPSRRFSKLEIVPGSGDTLLYPDAYTVRLRFRGYYGDAFIPRELDDSYENKIEWSVVTPKADPAGELTDASGTAAAFRTDNTGGQPQRVVLAAALTDCRETRQDCPCTTYVTFRVAATALSEIEITRVDPVAPAPISNAAGSRAEFMAYGKGADSSVLSLTPLWRIGPSRAGRIDSNGVFTPADDFVGQVQIIAGIVDMPMEGTYQREDAEQPGIQVYHSVLPAAGADTVTNYNTCSIVIPDSAVRQGEEARLYMARRMLTNLFEQGRGGIRVVSNAFDIEEVNGVSFPAGEQDSIQIRIEAPSSHAKRAAQGGKGIYLARWDEDSLRWDTLSNSRTMVTAEKDTLVTANVRHFSWYAVAAIPQKTDVSLQVVPNPFSPYVTIRSQEVQDRSSISEPPPQGVQGGTWIKFRPSSRDNNRVQLRLRIVSVHGETVWAAALQDAAVGVDHYVWWDGRSRKKEINLKEHTDAVPGNDAAFYVRGNAMCRNGRYYVMLHVKDGEKKEHKLQEVILVK
jgi:hypothetical protein